ncbi:phosphoribosyltransferase-like protein [Pontibacter pudoricolor]|uniref:phosphoribosyltransferase-like protein n=1 Tax=Pontibacter pudoricolor TaxID=2694930 RepID=UPI0013913DE5|nr:hypothetical protein [Pontibacter pudoricolor]
MNIKEQYRNKITQWSAEDEGRHFLEIDQKIRFLADQLYLDYEPTFGPFPDFISRLASWVFNVDDEEDQKLLLTLVPKIFYVGREEFNCLHRTAFNSHIVPWLVENGDRKFEDILYESDLENAISQTWFCPVTDSFRINQFYHLNQISSKHTFRPDWRSLTKFGDSQKIIEYIRINNVKNLVLLEDFVGSGGQASSPIKFACQLLEDVKSKIGWEVRILFLPMIICPKGFDHINNTVVWQYNELLSFKPIIRIGETDVINDDSIKLNHQLNPYAELMKRQFAKVLGSSTSGEHKKLSEFGYKNTGGTVVMFTNTPNNSLPVIFVESDTWSPLFKRHSRD